MAQSLQPKEADFITTERFFNPMVDEDSEEETTSDCSRSEGTVSEETSLEDASDTETSDEEAGFGRGSLSARHRRPNHRDAHRLHSRSEHSSGALGPNEEPEDVPRDRRSSSPSSGAFRCLNDAPFVSAETGHLVRHGQDNPSAGLSQLHRLAQLKWSARQRNVLATRDLGKRLPAPQNTRISSVHADEIVYAYEQGSQLVFPIESIAEWDGNEDRLRRWLDHIDGLSRKSNIMDRQLGGLVPLRLRGYASQWFSLLPEHIRLEAMRSWSDLRPHICGHFMASRYDGQRWRALSARYQESGHSRETPTQYFARKLEMLEDLCELDESEMIWEIMCGAPHIWKTLIHSDRITSVLQLGNTFKFYERELICGPFGNLVILQDLDRRLRVLERSSKRMS